MSKYTILVPDIGTEEAVELIELSINVGDQIVVDQALVTLESDKASMEIPSDAQGTVSEILVAVGDEVKQGVALCVVELTDATIQANTAITQDVSAPEQPIQAVEAGNVSSSQVAASKLVDLVVPDIGGEEAVEVIEVLVQVGDTVAIDDGLIVLESDKASFEVPCISAGVLSNLAVKVGDKVQQGVLMGQLTTTDAAVKDQAIVVAKQPQPIETAPAQQSSNVGSQQVYAGPAVYRLGRQLGVDLTQVTGTGNKGRIVKDDVRAFVKNALANKSDQASIGNGIPPVPAVDFSKFGEVEEKELNRIGKLTAQNMQRSWLNVPHVTQFDDADISELEVFRKQHNQQKNAFRLTPLPFLVKACVAALQQFPKFNASLNPSCTSLIYKKYLNIGIAVDTPLGLLVPVIKHANRLSLVQIGEAITDLAQRARDKKLKPDELSGACFTISSLGAQGGRGFTPIINSPELAILGVGKASQQPVYIDGEFQPRLLMPLALSYDHRAINGADGGAFMNHLSYLLQDVRRLLL